MKQPEQIKPFKFKTSRRPSLIISNFYSLITIAIISITIIVYSGYVLPAQKEYKLEKLKKEQLLILQQKQQLKRKAQIELSRKLNKIEY